MRTLSIALAAMMALAATPTLAAAVDVQLLNKGEKGAMVFEPELVRIAVGDTVNFEVVDKGHNVSAAEGMIPAAATPFKSPLSQPFSQTFTVPGVYVVKCDPHYGLGMVGVIVVGDDLSNLEAIEGVKTPKKAHDRLHEVFEELK